VKIFSNNDMGEIFEWPSLRNSTMCNIIDAPPPIACFYLRFLLDFNLPWNIKIVLNIIQPHYFKFMFICYNKIFLGLLNFKFD
jgi:hypothetical protein